MNCCNCLDHTAHLLETPYFEVCVKIMGKIQCRYVKDFSVTNRYLMTLHQSLPYDPAPVVSL